MLAQTLIRCNSRRHFADARILGLVGARASLPCFASQALMVMPALNPEMSAFAFSSWGQELQEQRTRAVAWCVLALRLLSHNLLIMYRNQ
jgi:hypothetical protein